VLYVYALTDSERQRQLLADRSMSQQKQLKVRVCVTAAVVHAAAVKPVTLILVPTHANTRILALDYKCDTKW
jgi:hypothetical protein